MQTSMHSIFQLVLHYLQSTCEECPGIVDKLNNNQCLPKHNLFIGFSFATMEQIKGTFFK